MWLDSLKWFKMGSKWAQFTHLRTPNGLGFGTTRFRPIFESFLVPIVSLHVAVLNYRAVVGQKWPKLRRFRRAPTTLATLCTDMFAQVQSVDAMYTCRHGAQLADTVDTYVHACLVWRLCLGGVQCAHVLDAKETVAPV